MDVMRAALLILLCGLALPAAAQTVYRCRSGDTWAYQDRPCSGDQAAAGTHTIRATQAGETPPAVQQMLDQQAAKSSREQASAEYAAARAALAPLPAAQSAPARGYRCVAGRGFSERVVYQMRPCDEHMQTGTMPGAIVETRPGPRLYDSPRTIITPINAPVMEKTTQEEVSAREVCERRRAELDPYTRSKTPNPCR